MLIRKIFGFWILLVFCSCSSLLYYPTKEQHSDPKKFGIQATKYNDVWFNSEDGTKLHGWFFESRLYPKSKAVIVFFHGNAENISTHFTTLLWVLTHGYDFFIFDYRGYGISEGEPSPRGTMEDGKAALRWAHRQHPKTPLVVFGQSLGGAIALRSALEIKGELPIRLIVADSTFHSYQTIGANVLSRSWLTWLFQPLAYVLLSDQYAPKTKIKELSPVPVVVIHGDKDQTVEFELGKKVYELAASPKEFWPIPGGYHIDCFWRQDQYCRHKLLETLKKIL